MVIKHELKILPCYFNEVVSGNKTFEIRDNSDRGFQKGDIVKLREFDPSFIMQKIGSGGYTGNELLIEITYVTNAYQKDNYIVFGFKKIKCQ